MIKLNVEYLTNEEIANAAEVFRESYQLTQIPIDIEYVVEFELGMDIIYQPGLREVAETDGYLTSDFSGIYIDAQVYDKYPYRYRFTLAHEVGHWVLHRDYFSQFSFSDIEEWINHHKELDQRDYGKLEYQGYTFGGYLLVPPSILKEQFIQALPKANNLIEQAKSESLDREAYIPYIIDFISVKLSPLFEVSTQSLIKRIENDELYKLIT